MKFPIKKVPALDYYLKLLEKRKIDPNFWCSLEYFEKAGWKIKSNIEGFYWIEDEKGIVLPPIHEDNKRELKWINSEPLKIWADFNNYPFWGGSFYFLDWEYIYDPKQFLKMEGGHFSAFRKNSRKWRRRNEIWSYEFIEKDDDILSVVIEWLDQDKNRIIEDQDVFLDYLSNGEHRRVLKKEDEIVAVNIWDENYLYINFRYCVCKPNPFLSEFVRYLFYTDPLILNKNKLVNDGGVLNRPELKKFKDKMNPYEVRKVYSITI